MKTIQKTRPETNRGFMQALELMCQPYPPFIKNQPKTRTEIDIMVKTLHELCEDNDMCKKDIVIALAQIEIIIGKAKASDFSDEKPDFVKAVKNAEKWLKGKVYDEALFA